MTPMPNSVTALLSEIDDLEAKQRKLGKALHDDPSRQPGPHAVFYHHGYLLERVADIRIILRRMGEQRAELNILNRRVEKARPKKQRNLRPSKQVATLEARIDDLTSRMRHDLEDLYTYGNRALDQWAHTIAYTLGLPAPEAYKYQALVMKLQSKSPPTQLRGLLPNFNDAIWLAYHLRMYRNIFIEHINRPWQRGTTMSIDGDDFNFFVPAASGSVAPDEVAAIAARLKAYAPAWLAAQPKDYWEWKPRRLLEVVFNEIDQLERQSDREYVWNAWAKIGGSTVNYLDLARRLTRFLADTTDAITAVVEGRSTQSQTNRT